MDHNQLVQYEQNLAACYETEYFLSMKVEDQDLYTYSYDDISEVSTVFIPNPNNSETPSMCDNDDMDTDDTRCHAQAQVEQQSQWMKNASDMTLASTTELGERCKSTTVHMDEEHSDGPNKKRPCLRQPNS